MKASQQRGLAFIFGGDVRRIVLAASLGFLALGASGCYNTMTSAKKVPTWVMMNTMPQGQVVAPYENSYMQWYALWGLIAINTPPVGEDMGAAIKAKGAKYIDSVEVSTGMKFPYLLLNLLTGIITVYNQEVIVTGNLKK
jgi:hypothetical protein